MTDTHIKTTKSESEPKSIWQRFLKPRDSWQAGQARARDKEAARSPSEKRRRAWISRICLYSLFALAIFLTGGPKAWRLNYDLVMTGIAIGAVMDVELDEEARRKVLHGALQALDHNSKVLSIEREVLLKKERDQVKEGTLGFVIARSPNLKVISVNPDGPAQKAGLRVGDDFISFDGIKPTEKLKRPQALITSYVRALNDVDEVEISVSRDGEILDLMIPIEVSHLQWAHRIGNFDGILQISITAFYFGVADQVRDIIDAERLKRPVKGVLFDLRDNPGGLTKEVDEIASLFLPEGTKTSRTVRQASTLLWRGMNTTTLPEVYPDIETIGVIINSNSASASEKLAAIVKDYDLGPVAGEVSYGKGSTQTTLTYPFGPKFRMTVARFTGPKGTLIDGVGVKPDVLPTSSDGKVVDWNGLIERTRKEMLSATDSKKYDLRTVEVLSK